MHPNLKISTLIASSCLFLISCRTNLRPQTDAAEPVKINIQLIGLKEADKSRSELIYTLSSCGSSSVSGTKSGDSVEFMAPLVANNDICKVRVNSFKGDSAAIKWFEEEGLMYEAENVTIRSISGKLAGTAYLQQLYTAAPTMPASKVFKITAGVKLPENANGTCTCSISCTPSLSNNVAEFETGSDKKSGACTFANVTSSELATGTCSKIKVQCGDKLYVGDWNPPVKFDGSVAKDSAFTDLTLAPTNISEISDTTIEVIIPTK